MPPDGSRPIQVAPSHYDFENYESFERWSSYWYQIRAALALNPKKVLEIGVGSGVFRSYLENAGVEVTSVDFDESRNPDLVAGVAELDEALPPDLLFDLVVCFQVLEHLPFSDFETCLAGIARRTTSHAIISLPYHGAQVRLAGALSTLRFSFGFYLVPPTRFRPTEQHEWEIDRSRTVRRLSKIISKYFEIEDRYFVKENPYHYFWVLRRRNAPQ